MTVTQADIDRIAAKADVVALEYAAQEEARGRAERAFGDLLEVFFDLTAEHIGWRRTRAIVVASLDRTKDHSEVKS